MVSPLGKPSEKIRSKQLARFFSSSKSAQSFKNAWHLFRRAKVAAINEWIMSAATFLESGMCCHIYFSCSFSRISTYITTLWHPCTNYFKKAQVIPFHRKLKIIKFWSGYHLLRQKNFFFVNKMTIYIHVGKFPSAFSWYNQRIFKNGNKWIFILFAG